MIARLLVFLAVVVATLAVAALWVYVPSLGLFLVLMGTLGLVIALVYQTGKRRERQAMLAWHLALATSRGRSLPAELRAFAGELPMPWRGRAFGVAEDVEGGMPLSVALADARGLLPSWAVTSVRVGEAAGRLPETLRDAALRMTREPTYRIGGSGPLAMSLVYLCLVLAICTSVVGYLMISIVPKLQRIFEGFGTDLPALTESMIAMTDWFVQYAYVVVPVLALPFALLALLAYGYRQGWSEFNVPLFLGWQLRFDTPCLARDLASSIEAELPVRTSLEAIAASHRRRYVRERLRKVVERLDAGGPAWATLGSAGFLSRAEVSLLDAAERVGNLPWALRALADARERRATYRLFALTQFVEPAVVLALGLFVMYLCIAFFLPLVKLLNDLS